MFDVNFFVLAFQARGLPVPAVLGISTKFTVLRKPSPQSLFISVFVVLEDALPPPPTFILRPHILFIFQRRDSIFTPRNKHRPETIQPTVENHIPFELSLI